MIQRTINKFPCVFKSEAFESYVMMKKLLEAVNLRLVTGVFESFYVAFLVLFFVTQVELKGLFRDFDANRVALCFESHFFLWRVVCQ